MKKGYSILLGEHLDALGIEYHDCERFQVVCPACREPVFKSVREAGRDEALHYLSHYSAARSFDSDCEMRTTAMSHSQTAAQDRTSRDQRLTYFLSVLKDTLSMDPMYQRPADKVHWALSKSTAVVAMRDGCFGVAQASRAREEFFSSCVTDYLRELANVQWELHSTFSLTIQERIARDMWLTITSPAGRSNFDFLFNHAFLNLLGGWQSSIDRKDDGWQMSLLLGTSMTRMMQARGAEGRQVLSEMASTEMPPEFNLLADGTKSYDSSTVFTRIAGKVVGEMVGTLLGVPYFELLKQKYGDSSKVYPYEPAITPSSEEEKARIAALRGRMLGSATH